MSRFLRVKFLPYSNSPTLLKTDLMKIAVLFGGQSAERDVSIASGSQVFKALKGKGHEVIAIDTANGVLSAEQETALLSATIQSLPPELGEQDLLAGLYQELHQGTLAKVDVVFVALHGGFGEDGSIQALFDMQGIRYTGSGRLASSFGMDKEVSKILMRAAGVPTADWLMAPCSVKEVEDQVGFPVVVKANKQGSSVGLSVVDSPDGLAAAIASAQQHDDEVMIERFVAGRELTVGVLAGKALEVGEIIPQSSELFDYESKYQAGGAEEIFPAELPQEVREYARVLGLAVHKALKLKDYSRVDFRLDANNQLWCLEANSLPGMTAASLLPKSAAACGIEFAELCETICRLAIQATD